MQILYPQFESGCRLFISKRNIQCIPFRMPVFERMALGVKRYRGLDLVGKIVAKFMPLRLFPPRWPRISIVTA